MKDLTIRFFDENSKQMIIVPDISMNIVTYFSLFNKCKKVPPMIRSPYLDEDRNWLFEEDIVEKTDGWDSNIKTLYVVKLIPESGWRLIGINAEDDRPLYNISRNPDEYMIFGKKIGDIYTNEDMVSKITSEYQKKLAEEKRKKELSCLMKLSKKYKDENMKCDGWDLNPRIPS